MPYSSRQAPQAVMGALAKWTPSHRPQEVPQVEVKRMFNPKEHLVEVAECCKPYLLDCHESSVTQA